MNQEDEKQSKYNDEIDLMEYISILIKRKWTVITFILIAVIIAGVYILTREKVYSIETVLEIGKIEGDFIEEPARIIGKIEKDFYGRDVREKLNIPSRDYPKTQAAHLRGTDLLILETQSAQTDPAKKILIEINNIIVEEHKKIKQDIIRNKKELVAYKIEMEQERKQLTENNIFRFKNKIVFLEEEIESLENKIALLQKANTPAHDLNIQFALIHTRQELAEKKREIESLYININNLKRKVQNHNAEISRWELSLEDIYKSETKIIRQPAVSKYPIGQDRKKNLALAGILGLMVGMFCAFGKEWWQNNKTKIQSK